jgi:hypothetical protein
MYRPFTCGEDADGVKDGTGNGTDGFTSAVRCSINRPVATLPFMIPAAIEGQKAPAVGAYIAPL